MIIIRILLLPFTILYGFIILFRNLLYRIGIFSRTEFDLPIVCIGNLSAGGTGKTPHIEWLIQHLQNQYKIAVLSRGYKRKTSGYVLADIHATPATIGDEPFQIYRKFPSIPVGVSENRVLGIPDLLADAPETELILMDDGFQHLPLKAGAYVLLTDYNNLFTNDWLLPSGLLREFRSGYKRAKVVIVTKCPDTLDEKTKREIVDKIKPTENQFVLFSSIQYGKLIPLFNQNLPLPSNHTNLLLVTGIANPDPLIHYLGNSFSVNHTIRYSDHHAYSETDIEKIISLFNSIELPNKSIVCTEKDAVKLRTEKRLENLPVYYIPIEIKLNSNDADLLLSVIRKLVDASLLQPDDTTIHA